MIPERTRIMVCLSRPKWCFASSCLAAGIGAGSLRGTAALLLESLVKEDDVHPMALWTAQAAVSYENYAMVRRTPPSNLNPTSLRVHVAQCAGQARQGQRRSLKRTRGCHSAGRRRKNEASEARSNIGKQLEACAHIALRKVGPARRMRTTQHARAPSAQDSFRVVPSPRTWVTA
jgi:hypothetical protein